MTLDGQELTDDQIRIALQDQVRLNWLETTGADVDRVLGERSWRVCTQEAFIYGYSLREAIDLSIKKG